MTNSQLSIFKQPLEELVLFLRFMKHSQHSKFAAQRQENVELVSA
jgi:hypothetical protein